MRARYSARYSARWRVVAQGAVPGARSVLLDELRKLLRPLASALTSARQIGIHRGAAARGRAHDGARGRARTYLGEVVGGGQWHVGLVGVVVGVVPREQAGDLEWDGVLEGFEVDAQHRRERDSEHLQCHQRPSEGNRRQSEAIRGQSEANGRMASAVASAVPGAVAPPRDSEEALDPPCQSRPRQIRR